MHLPAPDLESNELEEKKKSVEGDMELITLSHPQYADPVVCLSQESVRHTRLVSQ